MTISPSGTDIKYRDDMLPNLSDDDYYIFMIINYDEKRNIQIFDKAKNLVYDTEDVNVFVCDDQNNDIMAWVHTQEPLVKKRQYGSQTQSGHTTQTNTGNTTKDTDTQTTKDTETDKTGTIVIHTSEAPGDTAYWSNRMHLWVYEDKLGNKMYSTKPPKTSVANPNPEDDTYVTRKQYEEEKKSANANKTNVKGSNPPGRNQNTVNGTKGKAGIN
jgi:hypothetical protein